MCNVERTRTRLFELYFTTPHEFFLDVDQSVNNFDDMGRTSDADQRLMDAALSLMWEQSYGAITIDVICQHAGVNKGSFYYYYASKSELAVAALDRYWLEQKPRWDSQFSSATAPLQRIQNHCDAVYQKQTEIKKQNGRVVGCPFCALGSEICKQEETIHAKICEILGAKLKYWESAISDAQRENVIGEGDTAEKARCAVAYFEGLLAQARLHNDAEILATLGQRVCEHIVACSGSKTATAARSTAISAAAPIAQNEEFDPTRD